MDVFGIVTQIQRASSHVYQNRGWTFGSQSSKATISETKQIKRLFWRSVGDS